MDVKRYHSGETNPIVLPTHPSRVIYVGDLVICAPDDHAVSVRDLRNTDPIKLRAACHAFFAGVALQPSPFGKASLIRIATSGVFGFSADPGIYHAGDYVGPAFNGLGVDACRVAPVSLRDEAVARVVDPSRDPLLVEIISTLMYCSGTPDAALCCLGDL